MYEKPKVICIVLNYNGLSDTLECLDTLLQQDYKNYSILVVDNASDDGSADYITGKYSNIELVRNFVNLGFSGGNNVGLKKAFGDGAEYAFLINNDTIVDRCCLSRLVAAAEISPRAGLIGPAIYYYEKSGTIWSAGSTIDLKRGAWTHNKTVPDEDTFFEVDGLTGCSILVRHDAVLASGYLDPSFFLYVEDFEWNLRIKNRSIGFG